MRANFVSAPAGLSDQLMSNYTFKPECAMSHPSTAPMHSAPDFTSLIDAAE